MANVEEEAFNSFKKQYIIPRNAMSLWLQQVRFLLYKRLVIFVRRYLLAFTILVVPAFLEVIIALLIPASTILEEEYLEGFTEYGSFNLDINSYGSIELPYYVSERSSVTFNELLERFYAYSNRPSVNLGIIQISNVAFLFSFENFEYFTKNS